MIWLLGRLVLAHHIEGVCKPRSTFSDAVSQVVNQMLAAASSADVRQAAVDRARQRQAERRVQAAVRAAQRQELQAARQCRAIENTAVQPQVIQLEVIREER